VSTLDDELHTIEARLITNAIVRLRARVMALVFGVVFGLGLFLATTWLVLSGGENVGMHLGLLHHYFPGYSVTWPGAFIGMGWGGCAGAILGWGTSQIYNRVAGVRVAR